MKAEFQAKFLQHLNQKKQNNEGFTLIELLVVIIIIGVLAAIALPSFLNQANKAKQSEAKQYVGSMNRSQQAYYLEKGEFTTDIGQLGLGIKTQTDNYIYSAAQINAFTATNAMVSSRGDSRKPALKSYTGGVLLGTVAAGGEGTTLAVVCEKDTIGVGSAANPSYNQTGPTCVSGTSQVK